MPKTNGERQMILQRSYIEAVRKTFTHNFLVTVEA
jgi:uncharacterized protein YnzC (UPF0291/DUF896 family)